ncbi:MAG: SsrA-binding protein [Microgenomates group bacterium Gr01-1014_16]|nr:MAG: SsrA-binding protein [Microgenomates group bacterium Gr01-1014_16]
MKITNRKAYFDYEIKDTVEAGIQLTGAEVKSAKAGAVEMGSSHVKIQDSRFKTQREAWLVGMQIYPYKHADNTNYDPMRTRKLLLHQRELVALQMKMKSGGLTLIPTAIYTKSGFVKIELGLARGKRKYEKRESIKKRDLERGGDGGS